MCTSYYQKLLTKYHILFGDLGGVTTGYKCPILGPVSDYGLVAWVVQIYTMELGMVAPEKLTCVPLFSIPAIVLTVSLACMLLFCSQIYRICGPVRMLSITDDSTSKRW